MANFSLFAAPTQWVDITLFFCSYNLNPAPVPSGLCAFLMRVLTHSEVSDAGFSSLSGLASGSRGRGSLVLDISALAGGGLGGLRHGEGSGDSDREREGDGKYGGRRGTMEGGNGERSVGREGARKGWRDWREGTGRGEGCQRKERVEQAETVKEWIDRKRASEEDRDASKERERENGGGGRERD